MSRVLDEFIGDENFRRGEPGKSLLMALAQQAGSAGRKEDVGAVLVAVNALPKNERDLAGRLVRGLAEGTARQGGSLERYLTDQPAGRVRAVLATLLTDAQATARDNDRPAEARVSAIHMLALGPAADALPILEGLLDNRQPQDVQLAALAALGRAEDAGVAPIILAAWPALSPRMRSQAAAALLAHADRVPTLLDAIAAGQFKPAELEPARVQQLLAQPDEKMRACAAELLASVKPGRRQDIVDAYRPALQLAGDAAAGKRHFQKVCAACHRAEGVGHEIGANLAAIKNRGPEAILVNLLDPNREVNPQFVNYTLTTSDGRILTGMIDAETATSVTLKRAEGVTDTVLRVNIDELTATGQSLMPEGLDQQLDRQAIADLIAYLMIVP